MFEDFYKRYTINDKISNGLGIGLPLVKKISELLGGKVDVKTIKTVITFYVTLPLILEMGTCI